MTTRTSPIHAFAMATLAMAFVACNASDKGAANGTGATTGAASGSATVANANWAAYNNDPASTRYSSLAEITTQNVASLKPLCEIRLGEEGAFESGPVVIGDTMFVTTPHTTVALNATNCAVIWRSVDQPKQKDVFPVNRGVAYLDGRLFRGTPDGRLLALDAKSGKVLWDVQAGDPKIGEFLSSAPIAWNGMIFTGVAGSDWGVRGHMMAFDATTGKEKWRFYTVPMGNDAGADSWKIPETARRGGGAQWTSYTLDPQSGELFVPVANPAPDFAPESRPGDNLYTNSVVVLDANTGQLKWYYQLTPNDGFDWDLGAAPMLYTAPDGRARVALGSKDGYVYAVDRGSHKQAFRTAVTTIEVPKTPPTAQGVHACPGPLGGVEWNGPAYDPQTKMIYAGTVDWCAEYKSTKTPTYTPGQFYFGTSYSPGAADTASGWVTALDAGSGAVKWKFHAPQPVISGVTPTAGGVVFVGDVAGNFYAFDAATGKALLTYPTGGGIAGGVITYGIGGKQYVATTSGNVSRTTFKTTGSPTIIIMALNGPAAPHKDSLPDFSKGMVAGSSPTEHAQQGVAHGSAGDSTHPDSARKP